MTGDNTPTAYRGPYPTRSGVTCADFDAEEIDIDHIPETRTDVMINLGDPAAALRWWRLPCCGPLPRMANPMPRG